MSATLSTHSISIAERFDYWHEVVYRTYAPCLGRPASFDTFNAAVEVSDFGAVQITNVRSSGITYERRAYDVRTGPRDDFYAVAVLSGKTVVTQNGDEAVAQAGDIYLYNSLRPYSHHSEKDYECLSMRIPRPLAHARSLDVDVLGGRLICGTTPYAKIITSLMKDAAHIASNSGSIEMSDFSSPMLDMISAAIMRGTSDDLGQGMKNRALLTRITRYMKDHLADGDLTLTQISKDQNVSIRTLARLFAEMETTPMGWLQAQRLSAAYAALAERRVTSVTEAAFAFGFNDLSHFGRVFKKTYGHTPTVLLDHRRN